MPIKLRCYCGYILTLKSVLAGKKIRCTECDEILTVPIPGQKKSARKSSAPTKRRPPPRDPWDVDDFGSQPSYEQPQYFLPGPAGPTVTPKRRRKTSRQTDQQVMKYVGIALVVVFFGCTVLLGMFAMKNRGNLNTPENESARVEKEVGQGKLVGRTYTNEYFNLSFTVPVGWKIYDESEKQAQLKNTKNVIGVAKGSKEEAIIARQRILLLAKNHTNKISDNFPPTILIAAVRIGSISKIDTPRKYLKTGSQKKTYRLAGFDYRPNPIREGAKLGSAWNLAQTQAG